MPQPPTDLSPGSHRAGRARHRCPCPTHTASRCPFAGSSGVTAQPPGAHPVGRRLRLSPGSQKSRSGSSSSTKPLTEQLPPAPAGHTWGHDTVPAWCHSHGEHRALPSAPRTRYKHDRTKGGVLISSLARHTVIKPLVRGRLANARQLWEPELNLTHFGPQTSPHQSQFPLRALLGCTLPPLLQVSPFSPCSLDSSDNSLPFPPTQEMDKCRD